MQQHLGSPAQPHQVRDQGHGEAGLDQVDLRLQVRGLIADVGFEAGDSARLLSPVPTGDVVGLHRPRRPRRLLDRGDARQRAAGGRGQANPIRGERDPIEIAVPRRGVPRVLLGHHEIDVADLGRTQRRSRLSLHHLDPDQRVLVPQSRQHPRHQRQRGGLEDPDSHGADRLVQRRRQLAGRQLEPREHRVRVPDQNLGLGSQHDPASDAAQQRHAHLALQLTELLGHRGRRLMQRRRHLGDRASVVKLAQQREATHVQHDKPSENTNVIRKKTSLYLNHHRFHTGFMTDVLPIPETLTDDAVATVRRWLREAESERVDRAAARLAGLLRDPRGMDFTVGFIDGVIRPEDERMAAAKLAELARDVPGFLAWPLALGVKLGAMAGRVWPRLVIPIVRRVLRRMIGHLIVDARPDQIGEAIAAIREPGVRLNLNLLGEAVLGRDEAAKRLKGTHDLLARDDVDYVSIKVSASVAPHSRWAFEEAVDEIIEALLPLYEQAAAGPNPKFINLDMEEYHDLDLTMTVFTRILDLPQFETLSAGIVLQAYLSDALGAMRRLQEWSARRTGRGGAPIKVRIVKGANLPMERVEASMHGWPLAAWSTKAQTDAGYLSVIDYALHPERIRNVRIGVAGHNLFDLAWSWLLAGERGVRDGVDVEMLLGMAPGQAAAVRREVGELLLYTPVAHPEEFDVAIAYLVRRLEEGANAENFMSAVFELSSHEELFRREERRFRDSLNLLFTQPPAPNRRQDRRIEPEPFDSTFANTPDTDPSLEANRAWAREILGRADDSILGVDLVEKHTVTHPRDLEEQIAGAVDASAAWGALSGAERAETLLRAAHSLERHRAELLEVMASECGKTLDQADPEVSEAIDFARHYAELAVQLDEVDGATFRPVNLTLVVPPWNFPVAIPAGSTLAALAAGSSVIIKPAPQARRCGAIMVKALWDAGVPADALRLVNVAEDQLGRQLISDPRVDRLILTGAFETAELFRSFRPDLPLFAETSGKNSVIVTPSADLDLAVKDVVHSAFGHAGQKCSAASLVICVGSVARSSRFRRQLLDAVRSLRVAWPWDPTAQMGPIIEPAQGKLERGLTKLGPTETWLVRPRRLDDSGRLWSPGVRDRVAPGSEYHLTEYFGPILGIMSAETLTEAIELQNQVDYGLTAGLHSLRTEDIDLWLRTVQAGNLYVNRGITGAIVRRQPFGGWKKSVVGPGAKAGGPNYLIALGDWTSAEAAADDRPAPEIADFIDRAARTLGLDAAARARLDRSARSDAESLRTEFGVRKDVTGLQAERNVFRYLPCETVIRLADDGDPADLVRVAAAAATVVGRLLVSLPDRRCAGLFDGLDADVEIVAAESWRRSLAAGPATRVRLVGGSAARLAEAIGGRPDVAIYGQQVTESGRIELLPFVREQAISVTAHRFGTPDRLTDAIL